MVSSALYKTTHKYPYVGITWKKLTCHRISAPAGYPHYRRAFVALKGAFLEVMRHPGCQWNAVGDPRDSKICLETFSQTAVLRIMWGGYFECLSHRTCLSSHLRHFLTKVAGGRVRQATRLALERIKRTVASRKRIGRSFAIKSTQPRRQSWLQHTLYSAAKSVPMWYD